MLTDEDIDQPRTPSELRAFVEAVTEEVNTDETERHKGIMKTGVYKRYIEEVLPLSYYAGIEYSDQYRIQPVKGNQGYDANVFNSAGNLVERIEITSPQDGRAEAEDARLLVERGYGEAHVYGSDEQIDQLRPHITATGLKKSQKDYSDATLVIVLDLLALPEPLRARQDEAIATLAADLSGIPFKARRVRLFIPPDRVVDVAG